MENAKKQSLVERHGKVNIIIAALCTIFLVINSVIVSESALNQLSSNKYLAYILNFLVGCEGTLGTIGSMSNVKVFGEGEWWRLFLHMYLHAGVLHMLFNIFALLFAGKVVEKKIDSLPYLLFPNGCRNIHVIRRLQHFFLCILKFCIHSIPNDKCRKSYQHLSFQRLTRIYS